jgi:hypothetical protein
MHSILSDVAWSALGMARITSCSDLEYICRLALRRDTGRLGRALRRREATDDKPRPRGARVWLRKILLDSGVVCAYISKTLRMMDVHSILSDVAWSALGMARIPEAHESGFGRYCWIAFRGFFIATAVYEGKPCFLEIGYLSVCRPLAGLLAVFGPDFRRVGLPFFLV